MGKVETITLTNPVKEYRRAWRLYKLKLITKDQYIEMLNNIRK